MISYLTGTLAESSPNRITVEVGGVGYDVAIPLSSYENLPDLNGKVKVLIYQHVREDVLDLYGFLTAGERDLFKTLLGVTGIGPKVAIGILSGIAQHEFYEAIAAHDTKRLSSVPGVGKKTAERLILELKDKVDVSAAASVSAGRPPMKGASLFGDVAGALVALGYKQFIAENAARKVMADQEGKALPAEDLVRKALKYV
ncbi:MAG TPA: Holliday junction branch migration protein RuvA [bacterium]|nr:Holliday junction branch migration protein RuvA [bacterium]